MEPIIPNNASSVSLTSKNEFHVYKRRFFLLATLFVLNLSNAMVMYASTLFTYRIKPINQEADCLLTFMN